MPQERDESVEKTYWDNLGQGYQFYPTPTLDMITGFILSNQCSSVFEASCGTGHLIKTLRDIGYKGNYLGSDYCDSFINSAQINNKTEVFVKTNLLKKIKKDNDKFDVSVVHHGLDYVFPYRTALKELKRVSKKYVIITLWQRFDVGNNIRFDKEHEWNVNIYDRDEWYKELEACGYKIIVDAVIDEWNEKYGKQVYNHLFILKT